MTASDPAAYPAAQPPRNWFQRNWKWVVPVGCGSLMALFALSIFLLVFFVFSVIRNTDVFRTALERAKSSPEVRAELGDPIEEGWYVGGQVNVSGPSGHADISIPLKGSKNDGTLYAVASKSAGEWTYERLEVAVDGREERISLLGEEP